MSTLDDIGPELVPLARRAIGTFLAEQRFVRAERAGTPAAGVFVTLRREDGSLRGCIGSIHPVERDVLAETVRSAVLAATRDPRFEPVTPAELGGLSIEVSVLGPDEPAELADLDPRRYGVIVSDAHGRRGLLLPGIEGIDDVGTQVGIARQKAGIEAGQPLVLRRFCVTKLHE